MTTLLKLSFFFVLTAATQMAWAQTDSTASGPGVQLKLSVNYNSHLNYYGRTDSLKSSGLFPMAELWLGKDFYLNAAPVFVNNAAQNMDYAGTITTAGFLHSSEKWISHVYALKPFYETSAQLVQSALKAQAGASFTRLTPVVNLTLGGDVKWSDETDFGATAGIDHIFRKEVGNTVLVADPSVYAYAGTQRFSNTYIRKKGGAPLGLPTNERVTEKVEQFNVLAYEASLPLIVARGPWLLQVTPTYVLPQNLTGSEKGSPLWYATALVKYTF